MVLTVTCLWIQVYAKPEFDKYQMRQIRYGFYDLSMEQVLTYAKPEFDSNQMEEIRDGLINGLSMEEIKKKLENQSNS